MFKRPSEKAPSWVKGAVSIKIDEFISWVAENRTGDWLNLDLKESAKGTLYFSVNEYKKPNGTQTNPSNNI